jgi:hypothetical protein
MTDTKITAEQAREMVRLDTDDWKTRDALLAYIAQSERAIADLTRERDEARQQRDTQAALWEEMHEERDKWMNAYDGMHSARDEWFERAEKAEAMLHAFQRDLHERLDCEAHDDIEPCGKCETCLRVRAEDDLAVVRDAYERVRKSCEVAEAAAAESKEQFDFCKRSCVVVDIDGTPVDAHELIAKLRASEAAAAEMRAALAAFAESDCEAHGCMHYEDGTAAMGDNCEIAQARAALASTTGAGWRSPEEWAELVAERDELAQWHGGHLPTCGGMDESDRRCGCGYLQGEAYRELYTELHEANAKLAEIQALLKLDSHLDPVPQLRAVIESRDELRRALAEGQTVRPPVPRPPVPGDYGYVSCRPLKELFASLDQLLADRPNTQQTEGDK